jgi:ketosteroid isomerase-like protein
MPEEKLAGIVREFVTVTAAGDLEKTLAFFSEDAVLTDPYGTYKGKAAIKDHMAAMFKVLKDMKSVETGNRIIAQGNRAFIENVISGTFQGKKWEFLGMAAYEFDGDKIKSARETYDRLLIAKQVSPWPASIMVNMIVKQSEKAMK